jgi:hypothetical protein
MNCPFCDKKLKIIDVDLEGIDLFGCEECDWIKSSDDLDMNYYI